MKKVAIIGFGYVGKAFYKFFSTYNHYEVVAFDNNNDTINNAKQDGFCIFDIKKNCNMLDSMDLIVICVPTPQNKDGSVDLTALQKVLGFIKLEKLVLIKSTIPPLSTQRFSQQFPHLKIVFSPEYIGESSYFLPSPYDFNEEVVKTPYFIFGGERQNTQYVIEFFTKIAGPVKEYIQTSSLNAEICKYMENSFFATKIIFCNEFDNICKAFGADYMEVRELWLKDNRITKTHTLINNIDKNYCFGGKCLPKDLAGIIKHSADNGYKSKFLQSVQSSNIKPITNILMIHRIYHNSSQDINHLYFDRDMVIGYAKLQHIIESYLARGYVFGSLEECLQEPQKFFCLCFDDGFKEHLEIAKKLKDEYNAKQDSLLFCINVSNSIDCCFSGMDTIYTLAMQGKIEKVFDFFNMLMPKKSLLDNISLLKNRYINSTPKELYEFFTTFQKDLQLHSNFLNIREIQELSNIATICSHSMTHRNLALHKQDSQIEIKKSKEVLENILQTPISIFCYPEGLSDKEIQEFCKNANYKYALSIKGEIDTRFCIPRINIRDL